MQSSQSFIDRLRARPLHHRHLILWVGSFLIFGVIAWLWVLQLKVRLADMTGFERTRVVSALPAQSSEEASGGFVGVLKKAGASFLSLFGREEEKEPPKPQRIKEGDELDTFLEEYKPFPNE